jgi:hypothetical protein
MTASAAATGGPGTGTPAGAGTGLGFCRVTIVAPDSRIDVALPDDIPVADIYPEILRLSQQSSGEGAPVGYHLVRRDGTVLDSSRSFTAQRILDNIRSFDMAARLGGEEFVVVMPDTPQEDAMAAITRW